MNSKVERYDVFGINCKGSCFDLRCNAGTKNFEYLIGKKVFNEIFSLFD